MSRTSYHAAYYKDTAPRRRYLANFRKALRINCVWLLEEIRNHRESEPSVNITPRLQPIRRPVLKLNCDASRRTNENDDLVFNRGD